MKAPSLGLNDAIDLNVGGVCQVHIDTLFFEELCRRIWPPALRLCRLRFLTAQQ